MDINSILAFFPLLLVLLASGTTATTNPETVIYITVDPTTFKTQRTSAVTTSVETTKGEETTSTVSIAETTSEEMTTDEKLTTQATFKEMTEELTSEPRITVTMTIAARDTTGETTEEPSTSNSMTTEVSTARETTTGEETTVKETTEETNEPITLQKITQMTSTVTTGVVTTTQKTTTGEETTVKETTEEPITLQLTGTVTTELTTAQETTTREETTVKETTEEPSTLQKTTQMTSTVNTGITTTAQETTTGEETTVKETTGEPTTLQKTTQMTSTVTNGVTTAQETSTGEETTIKETTEKPTTPETQSSTQMTTDMTTAQGTTTEKKTSPQVMTIITSDVATEVVNATAAEPLTTTKLPYTTAGTPTESPSTHGDSTASSTGTTQLESTTYMDKTTTGEISTTIKTTSMKIETTTYVQRSESTDNPGQSTTPKVITPTTKQDPCDSSPCLNNGTCIVSETAEGYDCSCTPAWTGLGCETDVDECSEDLDNCHSNASCIDSDGGFQCNCNPGFKGNGTYCEDIDECSQDYCVEIALCKNTPGSYGCTCPSGYEGDGETGGNGCSDIDECANGANNCSVHAKCENEKGGFSCQCFGEYAGDGTKCQLAKRYAGEVVQNDDVFDENLLNKTSKAFSNKKIEVEKALNILYEDLTGFLASEVIEFKQGSTISVYISAFEEDSPVNEKDIARELSDNCNGTPNNCTIKGLSNINLNSSMESISAFNECDYNEDDLYCETDSTICKDSAEFYECECLPGYEPINGVNRACEEIDECSSNPCLNNGTCVDKIEGYGCICSDKFSGTKCENTPCEKDPCKNGGTCSAGDIDDDYICSCKPGYYTGVNCEDFDTLIIVIIAVSCAAGFLILVFIIVIIVLCAKSNKASQPLDDDVDSLLARSGYQPRVMRARLYDPSATENMEMKDRNGDSTNLYATTNHKDNKDATDYQHVNPATINGGTSEVYFNPVADLDEDDRRNYGRHHVANKRLSQDYY